MTGQADVMVVGSVNRDYVCRVDVLPAPGETVLGGEASVGSGGKGGNQAVAANLLGAHTALQRSEWPRRTFVTEAIDRLRHDALAFGH